MKTKSLLFLLLLAALCPWTAMAQKTHIANTASSTAMTWAEFADIVNNGTSYEGVTVYLDEDITATIMVGTNETNCFKGTFEGNNHTLTFNYTTNGWYMAPFRYLNGATIQNLKVDGTITANSSASVDFPLQLAPHIPINSMAFPPLGGSQSPFSSSSHRV